MRIERGAVGGPDSLGGESARHFPAPLAELALAMGVAGAQDAMLDVRLPIEVRRELGQAAETLFAFPDAELRQLALRDVLGRSQVVGRSAAGVFHQPPAHRDPERAAVAP